MTDAERIEALLDIADPAREADPARSAKLKVLGLAESVGAAGYRPTTAGWSALAERGRAFRNA